MQEKRAFLVRNKIGTARNKNPKRFRAFGILTMYKASKSLTIVLDTTTGLIYNN